MKVYSATKPNCPSGPLTNLGCSRTVGGRSVPNPIGTAIDNQNIYPDSRRCLQVTITTNGIRKTSCAVANVIGGLHSLSVHSNVSRHFHACPLKLLQTLSSGENTSLDHPKPRSYFAVLGRITRISNPVIDSCDLFFTMKFNATELSPFEIGIITYGLSLESPPFQPQNKDSFVSIPASSVLCDVTRARSGLGNSCAGIAVSLAREFLYTTTVAHTPKRIHTPSAIRNPLSNLANR